jgi:hypothetical protein
MNNPPTLDPLELIRRQSAADGWGGTFEYATAFTEPKLNDVLKLWKKKAGGGIPARTSFAARELVDVLPNFWLAETVHEDGRLRYRIRRAGTAVAAVMGDMTGKFLDEAIPQPLVRRWEMATAAFIACSRPVRFNTIVDLPHANFLLSESFNAPLLDIHGAQTILMAVSFFQPVQAPA